MHRHNYGIPRVDPQPPATFRWGSKTGNLFANLEKSERLLVHFDGLTKRKYKWSDRDLDGNLVSFPAVCGPFFSVTHHLKIWHQVVDATFGRFLPLIKRWWNELVENVINGRAMRLMNQFMQVSSRFIPWFYRLMQLVSREIQRSASK